MRTHWGPAGLLATVLGLALGAGGATAATFTVNDAGSAGDDDASAGGGDDMVCDSSIATGGEQCTLRAAIQEANDQTGPHTIVFDSSITAIQLAAALDMITAPVTIDGTNASAVAGGGRVDIDGNNLGCFSFSDATTAANANGAEGSTITKLVVRGCSGSGISISGHGYTISDNRVGTMPDGNSADGNSLDGIAIAATAAPPPSLPDLSAILAQLPQDFATIAAYSATVSALLSSIAEPVFVTGNLVSGNADNGIEVFGTSVNVVLAGNLVGTNVSATASIPNGTGGGNRAGVLVDGNSYGNFVGPGNVISGNNESSDDDGLVIVAPNVLLPNIVMGNVIGLGLVAGNDIGNADVGVFIDSSPDEDDSGMNNPKNPTGYSVLFGPANVVSDNRGVQSGDADNVNAETSGGMLITGTAKKVRVFGNVFGLGAFPAGGTPIGSLDYGNAGTALIVTTSDHDIGGSLPFEANVFAGNGRHGILVRGSGVTDVRIRGNFIGVSDFTGLGIFDFGNGMDGLHIYDASSVVVGGPGDFDDNVIAGNGRHGVKLFDAGSEDTSGWSNLFQRNRIYANDQDAADGFTGLGIDLDRVANGVDPVDVDLGPDPNLAYGNYAQNAPQICTGAAGQLAPCLAGVTQPAYSGGTTTLQWTVQTGQSRSYRAEFFSRTATGMSFLGEQMVTTNAAGLPNSAGCVAGRCTSAVTPMSAVDTRGSTIVMTITDVTPADVPPILGMPQDPLTPSNNTSEFSNGVVIPDPGEVRFVNLPANLMQAAAENGGTVTFQVERLNGSDGAVSVDLQVTGGTATNATDYALGTVTATWMNGETGAKNVTVDVTDDMTDEPDETVLLGLGNATGMVEIVSPSTAQLTITDDDAAPSASINDVSLAEGTGGASTAFTFDVTLSGASAFTVTVDAASATGGANPATPGVDYTALGATTLTFVPGDVSETVTVLVTHDAMDEPAETFLVNLSNPSMTTIGDGSGLGTIQNDDAAFAIADAVAVAEGNAGTTMLSFTITRSGDTSMPASVTAASADGTATLADMDYQQLPPTVVGFGAGVAMQSVMVTVNGDTTFEADETVLVNLSMPVGAAIADGSATGTITNDDAQPAISIGDVGLAEGNAGTTPFVFSVTLSNASSQTVTVNAASADGTATLADADYQQLVATTVTFVPGDVSETVTVNVVGDTADEPPPQDFTVSLSAPTNASIGDGTGTGSIQNDDAALAPSFAIGDAVAVLEGAMGTTNLVFTITRSGVVTGTDSVTAASADGTATLADMDYAQLPATVVTFAPLETEKQVMLAVNGDTTFETDETVLVNLTLPTAGSISDAQGSGTITNDDAQPAISIGDVGLAEGNAGTTPFAFTVTLSNASSQTVTVSAASADGTATLADADYQQLMATTVTFAPGDVSETVTVNVVGDTADEPPPQDFTVNLSAPTNASIGDGTGTGSIQNDDAAVAMFSIADTTQAEGDAGTAPMTFTVTRGGDLSGTVTVEASSADGTATTADGDYVALAPTVLTFGPNVTQQTVDVPVNGDTKLEPDETFVVGLANASSGTILDASATGTLTNDDAQPTIAIADLAANEGNAGSTPFAFAVTLSNPSSQTITVSAASSAGTATAGADYTALAATTVTFVPGDVAETVTVNVAGDTTPEAGETFLVDLTAPVNATIADGQALGTIANDDQPVLVFTGPTATGTGPFTGTLTGGGGPFCGFVATTQLLAAPPGAAPVPPTLPAPNAQFPHGLFQATFGNCTAGATINLTYTYPQALPAGTVFWKYGREVANPAAHWYPMPATIVGNTVTFAITDGGQGDDDLVANGTIVDPAGPAFVGQVAGQATSIPTLSDRVLALLALLVFVIGFRALGSRSP